VSATPPATMTHSGVSDSGPVDNRTVPSAPTGVAAVGGIDQAVVTFAAPSDDGGASVSGYTVTASPGGATGSGATSPITISGLAPGPYTFTVTASNALGVGPASSASLEVTVSATLPPTQGGVSNTGPTVSAPGSFTVTEDVAGNLTYTGTPFADADTASLTVTLSVADGAITGSAGTGITVSGTATARTFAGTVSDLNAYFTTAGKITYQGNGVQFSVSF
jgi:hypothetical protein